MSRSLYVFYFIIGLPFFANAQSRLVIKTIDADSRSPVVSSIAIKQNNLRVSTDTLGTSVINFSINGSFTLVFTSIGYQEREMSVNIPYTKDTLEVELESEEHEMEEVILQSTRTSRTIANTPTRVETIEFEEIDEKNNMRPGNVAMLLHESTGIQVQQTSATSGNASIRIQGLDGRYTQLLKDGFANFGNFSGGLSVLEIPPLDLKQVEIIKGPASPLFGGGAIAGVINFISKTPGAKPEYNFILNYSHIGQGNIGGFASGRNKKISYTLLALYNHQKPYDVDKDDFTEVPKSNEITIHPKLFFYPNDNTIIQIGNSFTNSERKGGDIFVVKGKADANHQYFENNKSIRNISTFELDKKLSRNRRLLARQSVSVFDREIEIPSYSFKGTDLTSYTDVSYIMNVRKHALVTGANFSYNNFKEKGNSPGNRNNRISTGGIYAQHTLDASKKIKLETGLRLDLTHYQNSVFSETEFFVLPRVSLFVKFNESWSSRIGAGMGYKTPTIFTEETETIQYRNVSQLDDVISEESYGATADINWRTKLADELAFSFNHMFFYTIIVHPLVLETNAFGIHQFNNSPENVHSWGFETNARFVYRDNFKLFLGYTFTDAKADYLPGKRFLHLVPRHKLNTALIYEKEGTIKLGLEGYFTGRQYLSNGTTTPSFEELGFMAEKIFKKFSLYINFENFTDTRQSKYKSVVNGSHLNPSFDEIWTHTEGFVVNGGIKIKL
jgi:outer membrane receptor for ferrienterochelin and colicins